MVSGKVNQGSGVGSAQIEHLSTETLIPYARNSRTHSEQQVSQIAGSIQEFGFCNPVLIDGAGVIIAGHGRVMAAQRLKLATVPCLRLSHLTDAQKRAYVIADNRLALSGGWDEELLANELSDLRADEFDLALLGFDADELTELLNFELKDETPQAEIVEDEVPEAPADPVTKAGDLWILGEHRLLCGDSTKAADVSRLMAGEKADSVVTDPPYNVDYVGKTEKALTISNDKKTDAEFRQFLDAVLAQTKMSISNGSAVYVFCPLESGVFLSSFLDSGLKLQSILVWVKNSIVIGRKDYQYKHEPIIYGWKEGEAHRWFGGYDKSTVMEFDRPSRSEEHPTMKPAGLIGQLLTNSTQKGDAVYDPFLGSGTTLIAAEQLGRKCYGMEISPMYCDIIVKRWENLTGEKAVLEAA